MPSHSDSISIPGSFDGLGLRSNDSVPVNATDVVIPGQAQLGQAGQGLTIILDTVLPLFSILSAAVSIGLIEGTTNAACRHTAGIRYDHMDMALRELPTIRAYLARVRIMTDQTRCLWLDTVEAVKLQRSDAMLRLMECKAAAGESAIQVNHANIRRFGFPPRGRRRAMLS
ncbi:MAG: acyl-CoA/acyl-ACP dehydrogenase [Nitrosomonas sp.]|nr:MAG: acyl-CoA/acyl-ACP dehydrogenase [Nitrosomonas sp.]